MFFYRLIMSTNGYCAFWFPIDISVLPFSLPYFSLCKYVLVTYQFYKSQAWDHKYTLPLSVLTHTKKIFLAHRKEFLNLSNEEY